MSWSPRSTAAMSSPSRTGRLAAYRQIFRIRLHGGLQYRVAALAGLATQFAWGFMKLLMYRAFRETNPAAFPMSPEAIAAYVWLQQGLLSMLFPWFLDNQIFVSITSGQLAVELLRPYDLYTSWFVANIGRRLAATVLRALPLFAVAVCLPAGWRLGSPASGAAGLSFALSLSLTLLLVTAFTMFVYIASLRALSPLGARTLLLGFSEFLTGGIIPIPFMPPALQHLLALTPFASMQDVPLRLWSGDIPPSEAVATLGRQAFWVIVLVALGWLWMRRALRAIVLQGG